MKKHLTTLLSFAMMMFMAITTGFTLASCGEEVEIDTPPSTTAKTEFTDGGNATRTAIDKDRYFYWTTGDNIWVEKTAGTWVQSTSNTITTMQPKAKFYFDEALPEETYNVRYTGFGNTSANSVTVAATQNQSVWDNGAHIAMSGDCGVAEATHIGERKYQFHLLHKAAYIVLCPYMVSSHSYLYTLDRTYTLMKVEVKAEDGAEISGTFNFGNDGFTGAATSGGSDMITLNCGSNGFLLENNSNPAKHYLVIVLRPTENKRLIFTYYVKDNNDGSIFTYEVSPGIATYSPNGVTEITHTIPDMIFDFSYYMWDAPVGATYSFGTNNYNTVTRPTQASRSCKDMPNINELYWYYMGGEAFFDTDTRWRLKGETTLHSGGVWILKKENIVGFNNTADADGIDQRSTYREYLRKDIPVRKYAPLEFEKYFFLPAMGRYHQDTGNLSLTDNECIYWSSSPTNILSSINANALCMIVTKSGSIRYGQSDRGVGMIGGKRPNGTKWFQ